MKCLRILGWLSVGVVLTGCEFSSADDFADDETEFENNASVAVTVMPGSDEEFEAFTLEPGTRAIIRREGAQANFSFDPTDTVQAEQINSEEVIFTDR